MQVEVLAHDSLFKKLEKLLKKAESRGISYKRNIIFKENNLVLHKVVFSGSAKTLNQFVSDSKDLLKKYNEKTIVVA